MSRSQPTKRRVTYAQQLHLWEFLKENKEIATGYNKSSQARQYSKLKWERVASLLNSVGEGAVKSGVEWSKYWVDLKSKIKRKNRLVRDARAQTGGGALDEEELTELEMKFIEVLGDDFGCGLPGVQVNPFILQVLTALYFYAHGCYQKPIGKSQKVAQQTVSAVLAEVTAAINTIEIRNKFFFS